VRLRLYESIGRGGAPAADVSIESVTAARTSDGEPCVLASVRTTAVLAGVVVLPLAFVVVVVLRRRSMVPSTSATGRNAPSEVH
jgi:hypothetical protein